MKFASRPRSTSLLLRTVLLLALPIPSVAAAQHVLGTPVAARAVPLAPCAAWDPAVANRNPTPDELRCRYQVRGPGRFGLLSYEDVLVYQPATPLPGSHVVGFPGLPRPHTNESYEAWEWRVHRTRYSAEEVRAHRELEMLDPLFASRLLRFEQRLAEAGVRARRRETWRSPARQEYLFQQGRSRPGALATATLTSWHCRVDERGQPAARAADYDVSGSYLVRFHRIAEEVGLSSFGADSFDPGHVFLPDRRGIAPEEVALLRLLPRVPHVTLATGRPTDERLDARQLRDLREAAAQWIAEPLVAAPEPSLAGIVPRLPWYRTPIATGSHR